MTRFLDVRLDDIGGGLAAFVSLHESNAAGAYAGFFPCQLPAMIQGRHVLIATHGFNVARAAGIADLSNWESLLQLPEPAAFFGLLWPGDSTWAHGLDYPEEPKIANEAGKMIAEFIDENFQSAASVSFASHSLGARVVLATVAHLVRPVRRVTLMAPAVDDNCLNKEFSAVAGKIQTISVLASKKDTVLSEMFPLGNFFSGIIAEGHPWWHAALGHCGPTKPWPTNFKAPFEIPKNWNYKHSNYLQIDAPEPPLLPIPTEVPPNGAPIPETDAAGNPIDGWQEAFSSAFASTRFR